MSIVIIFNEKDPQPWLKVLKQKLPDVEIEIYPEVKDPAKIDFALCWKPRKNVIKEFPNLLVAQSVGASADHIMNTQELQNIIITRIVDQQLTADMFEYILTGIMNYLKNTDYYYSDKSNKNWEQRSYKTITETTVCILGLGEIGSYVAGKLSSLGFKTKGWAKSGKNLENVTTFHDNEGLKHALNGTDVLINLLPLTKETENILCRENLSKINKESFLINVGRGENLVEDDLIHCLENKQLSGALLDVFRQEPLPQSHPFWTHDKITITPHVASLTNVETASDGVVENFRKMQRKEPLANRVSIKNGY